MWPFKRVKTLRIKRYYTDIHNSIELNSVENLMLNNASISHGIYFLMQDKEIIYIGKSINITNRLLNHKAKYNYNRSPKSNRFDSVKVFVFKHKSDIHYLEPYLISMYKPRLNKDFMDESIPSITINWRDAIKKEYKIIFDY